jgi:hypothetical protein
LKLWAGVSKLQHIHFPYVSPERRTLGEKVMVALNAATGESI